MNRFLVRSALRGLACLLIIAGVVSDAWAQSRVATTAAPFLTIGTGARGSALGHAYTAIATGGDALFWNPGAAARPLDSGQRGSVFFSHFNWLVGIDYNALGLTLPVTRSGVLGLSVAQMDYGRMDVRTVNLPNGTGDTFGATDLVVGLSYAQPLTPDFYIGGTAKYVRQSIYDMAASTVAFDIGLVLDTEYLNGLRLAASIMNFGGKMQMGGVNNQVFVDVDPNNSGSNSDIPARLENDRYDLPLSFKFGVALPVVSMNNVQFLLLADSHQTNDNDLNADVGSQLQFSVGSLRLDLRAGYKDVAVSEVDSHLTFGSGLELDISGFRAGFDFAFVPYERLGNVQMLDARIYF